MKKLLLSGLTILALASISFAQTTKHSANFYRINFDAAAGTAIVAGFPGLTAPAGTYDLTCVTNAVRVKGKTSPGSAKPAYGDFVQFELLNGAIPGTISTPTANSKKLGIKIQSNGSFTPPLTIQVKDGAATPRVIDHLSTITATSTATVFTIDLTNQLNQQYQGSNNGPLDSTKLKTIFLSFDHGTATSVANIPNIDFLISYFWIGDSTTVTTSALEAQANISSSKLYPNPTSDIANVALELKSSSDVKVTLTDLMGKEVMTIANGTMSSLNESFSVSNLNKGIYTVNYFINGSAAKAELLMVK